jgi:hypothetical protein
VSNFLLGAGRLYFDPLISGAYRGERYLGQSPGFSISVDSERIELTSSDGPTAEVLEDVVTKVTRNASLTLQEISADNLALFFSGGKTTTTQAGATVTAEAFNDVLPDRYLQLGTSTTFPAGARSVSAVVVKNDAGSPTTYALTDDYTVDAVRGRIYIVPGGAITAGTNLRIDYTSAAKTWETVTSGNVASLEGKLRYVEDATRGTNRDFFFPKVDIGPSGDFSVKSRDEFAELPFEVKVLKPDTGEAIYIDGLPA